MLISLSVRCIVISSLSVWREVGRSRCGEAGLGVREEVEARRAGALQGWKVSLSIDRA